jgi:hypothetical protein
MDQRDREWRDRDWRRAEDLGRSRQGRRGEDRSWAGSADDDRGYPEEGPRGAGGYGADEQEYGAGSALTRGGAYDPDPIGARSRYSGYSSRMTSQDYTTAGSGSPRDYDFEAHRPGDYGRSYDRRDRRGSPDYGADRDWETERDVGWARFDPEGEPRDYARGEQRGRERWDDRGDQARVGQGRDFLTRAGERISSWFRGSDLMHESRQADHGEPRRYREEFVQRVPPVPRRDCRGRGPRGYKRSDERISDDVHDRLTDDPWLDATHIEVEVKGGEVTLGGVVDDREAKHRAEWLIEDISGVTHVQNNLRVDAERFTGAGRGFGSSALEAEMRRSEQAADDAANKL